MNRPSTPYIIRPGRLADAPAMARIFNHYVSTSDVIFSNDLLSSEQMRHKLEPVVAGRFPFLVAEIDGEVAGYCYAHRWMPDPVYGHTWEVTEYLSSPTTSKGIGTALLAEIIVRSRDAGAHSLISCVTATNVPCVHMLGRLGFERVGCVKESGYKFGRWHDDLFFQLML